MNEKSILIRRIKLAEIGIMFISLPDRGVTNLLHKDMDRSRTAAEIDRFNMIKNEECDRAGVRFINVTAIFRRAGGDPSMMADDNLRPFGKEHTPWADTIVPLDKSALLREATP